MSEQSEQPDKVECYGDRHAVSVPLPHNRLFVWKGKDFQHSESLQVRLEDNGTFYISTGSKTTRDKISYAHVTFEMLREALTNLVDAVNSTEAQNKVIGLLAGWTNPFDNMWERPADTSDQLREGLPDFFEDCTEFEHAERRIIVRFAASHPAFIDTYRSELKLVVHADVVKPSVRQKAHILYAKIVQFKLQEL